jgi:hypothetical protein
MLLLLDWPPEAGRDGERYGINRKLTGKRRSINDEERENNKYFVHGTMAGLKVLCATLSVKIVAVGRNLGFLSADRRFVFRKSGNFAYAV